MANAGFQSSLSRLCLLTFDGKNSQAFNIDLGNSSPLIEYMAKKQPPPKNLLKTHKSCPTMSTSIPGSKFSLCKMSVYALTIILSSSKYHLPISYTYFNKIFQSLRC